MNDRFEGEVANLNVEGELVDPHPAGADQHLVVLSSHQAVAVDGEERTRGSFVLFCPVVTQEDQHDRGRAHQFSVEVASLPSGGGLWYHLEMPPRKEKKFALTIKQWLCLK